MKRRLKQLIRTTSPTENERIRAFAEISDFLFEAVFRNAFIINPREKAPLPRSFLFLKIRISCAPRGAHGDSSPLIHSVRFFCLGSTVRTVRIVGIKTCTSVLRIPIISVSVFITFARTERVVTVVLELKRIAVIAY